MQDTVQEDNMTETVDVVGNIFAKESGLKESTMSLYGIKEEEEEK